MAFGMWKVSLLLLVTYGGLTDANEICDENDLRRCYPSHMNGISFPGNEEELNELCPPVISYMSCLKTYTEECGIENSVVNIVVEERLEKFYQVIVEACDQSSELHHDISKNLGCLKGVFENHRNSCVWTVAALYSAKEYLHLDYNDEDNINWKKLHCLNKALGLVCLASSASETCGPSAGKVFLDTFKRLGHLEFACKDEKREGLAELLPFLELDMKSKPILEGIFTDNYFS